MTYLYFIGGGLVLLALVTKFQKSFLPEGIATQIGHNSEAVCVALAVGLTIQFARPVWLRERGARRWVLPIAVGAVWILLAIGVYYLGLPSSIKTLNEPLAAAGLLTFYLGVPRPWKHSWVVPAVVVVVVLIGINVRFIVAQSETVTSLVLVAISVDLVQRSILRRDVRDGPGVFAWWAFLAIWPALMQGFNRAGTFGGYIGDVVDYQSRGAEGFWGAFLICVYFGLRHRLETRAEKAEIGSRQPLANGT